MARKDAPTQPGKLAHPAARLRDALGQEAHLRRRVDTLLRHFGFSELSPHAEETMEDALKEVGVATDPSLRDPDHGTVVSLSLNGNSKTKTTKTTEAVH